MYCVHHAAAMAEIGCKVIPLCAKPAEFGSVWLHCIWSPRLLHVLHRRSRSWDLLDQIFGRRGGADTMRP